MVEIIEEVGKDSHGQRIVKCKCECGNEFTTRLYSVKTGATTSCGCIRNRKMSNGMRNFWKNIDELKKK